MSYEHFSRYSEQAIKERIDALIQRGTLGTVDDARMMQEINVRLRNGYKPKKVEHWHPYGMSTHPNADAEVLALSPGGDMDHLVIIATADRRYRLKVEKGEVALHDDQNQVVHFKRDGMHVKTSKPITLEGEKIIVKGNIEHQGNIVSTGFHQAASHV